MKCIIIEDQLPAQRVVQKYLANLSSFHLAGTFQNAIDAIDFLSENDVDLIFLDINLPQISGVNFLRNLSNPPQVIITSAYPQYALEGFELNVVDYLLKPFSIERFLKAISKIKISIHDQDTIFIKSDKEFFQVAMNDILYIKGDDDFTRVYTKDKLYIDKRTMKTWIEELSDSFLRIHKSYIINRKKITKISGQRVFLDDIQIPIGRSYKESVMKIIN
ncbi:MAG: LytTR family DNA-binding domain-containing protein [Cyclobacteriaceae bacterium]